MPLSANVKLAPNFTAHELGADKPEATDAIVANLRKVAGWLQSVRGLFARPILVTSGFRPPVENEQVGGSPTSDHPLGLAADFKVQGVSPYSVYQELARARKAGTLLPFDQVIFYAADDHIHVGLGGRLRGELLFKTTEGTYEQLAGNVVQQIRGYL